MTQNGVVDLDVLLTPKRVKLQGKEYSVKDVDGIGYQMLLGLPEGGPRQAVVTMYQLAVLALPDLTEEEVMKLNAAQVGAVVELAAENVEMIEGTVPKVGTSREKKGTPST